MLNANQQVPLMKENQTNRTVTVQDLYDVLTPFTSRDETFRGEPELLIGFQANPQLQERQKQQQRAVNKAAEAPLDLRDKINANKRARKQAEQAEQTGTTAKRDPPIPSPTQQPEAWRIRITRELLTPAEMQQLDIAASEVFAAAESDPIECKFEQATSREDPGTVLTVERATIGAHYI